MGDHEAPGGKKSKNIWNHHLDKDDSRENVTYPPYMISF